MECFSCKTQTKKYFIDQHHQDDHHWTFHVVGDNIQLHNHQERESWLKENTRFRKMVVEAPQIWKAGKLYC